MEPLDKELYSILACPVCHGGVHYDLEKTHLVCKSCSREYEIRDGVPIMLANFK